MQSISKCNQLVNSIRMCVVSCSGIAIDGHAHTNTSSYSIASMQQSLVYSKLAAVITWTRKDYFVC